MIFSPWPPTNHELCLTSSNKLILKHYYFINFTSVYGGGRNTCSIQFIHSKVNLYLMWTFCYWTLTYLSQFVYNMFEQTMMLTATSYQILTPNQWTSDWLPSRGSVVQRHNWVISLLRCLLHWADIGTNFYHNNHDYHFKTDEFGSVSNAATFWRGPRIFTSSFDSEELGSCIRRGFGEWL